MTRKVLVGALLVSWFAVGFASAEDKAVKSQPIGRSALPPYWNRVGLTDEQKDQIRTIQSQYRTKIQEMQREIQQMQKKERAEMEKVLTDAQKARLREMMAERAPGGSSKDRAEDKKADEKKSDDKKGDDKKPK